MADPLYIDGRYTTTDQRVIAVEDRGLQFGDSVYEVLKFLRRTPLFVDEHWRRLVSGLEVLAIPSPWNEAEELDSICRELIRRGSADEGIIYLQVTRGVCERTHFYPEGLQPTAIAYVRGWKFPDVERKRTGIVVVTAEDIRWKRCYVKSVNLLGNVLAKQEARKAGADEAILIDHGRVTEGSSSSFFAVREQRLITHPAEQEILPGTVREKVISLALGQRIRVDERPILDTELYQLDEAFITSTTLGVMPVRSIDGRTVGEGERGPVTQTLQSLFDVLERHAAE